MKITDAAVLGLVTRRRPRQEQTTSGNAGAFPVPLGPVLRRVFPGTAKKKRKQEGEVQMDVTGSPDETELYRRAVEELDRLR